MRHPTKEARTTCLASSKPYALQISKKDKAKHRAAIPAPFVGASHTKGVFTPDYEIAMKEINDPYVPKKLEKSSTTHFGPWRGTNPAKKGYNKTFQRFPQYIEEGEKPRRQASHEAPWMYSKVLS